MRIHIPSLNCYLSFSAYITAADPGLHFYGGRKGAIAPSVARRRGSMREDVPPSFAEEIFEIDA